MFCLHSNADIFFSFKPIAHRCDFVTYVQSVCFKRVSLCYELILIIVNLINNIDNSENFNNNYHESRSIKTLERLF